jgi:hypothetical protein
MLTNQSNDIITESHHALANDAGYGRVAIHSRFARRDGAATTSAGLAAGASGKCGRRRRSAGR